VHRECEGMPPGGEAELPPGGALFFTPMPTPALPPSPPGSAGDPWGDPERYGLRPAGAFDPSTAEAWYDGGRRYVALLREGGALCYDDGRRSRAVRGGALLACALPEAALAEAERDVILLDLATGRSFVGPLAPVRRFLLGAPDLVAELAALEARLREDLQRGVRVAHAEAERRLGDDGAASADVPEPGRAA